MREEGTFLKVIAEKIGDYGNVLETFKQADKARK
jgi:hypothetical protein